MNGINLVILLGDVVGDPNISQTRASGTPVANFTVVTSRNVKGNIYIERHNIVAYDKVAEIVAKYVDDSCVVYVEGRIQTNTWSGSTGSPSTEILANKVVSMSSVSKLKDYFLEKGDPTVFGLRQGD